METTNKLSYLWINKLKILLGFFKKTHTVAFLVKPENNSSKNGIMKKKKRDQYFPPGLFLPVLFFLSFLSRSFPPIFFPLGLFPTRYFPFRSLSSQSFLPYIISMKPRILKPKTSSLRRYLSFSPSDLSDRRTHPQL